MAFTENPAIFLPEFGKDVVLTPTAGQARQSRGIFDAEFSEGSGMGSTAPQIRVPSVDVPANISGGTALIDGTTYTVDHPEVDGTGWTLLVLER